MKRRNGMHCNVRKHSVIMYDETTNNATGVFVAKQLIGETVDDQLSKWRYDLPDVSSRELTLLNKTELLFLEKYLPVGSEYWEDVASHNLLVHSDDE